MCFHAAWTTSVAKRTGIALAIICVGLMLARRLLFQVISDPVAAADIEHHFNHIEPKQVTGSSHPSNQMNIHFAGESVSGKKAPANPHTKQKHLNLSGKRFKFPGITHLGHRTYRIAPALFRKALQYPEQILGPVRTTLVHRNAHPIGFAIINVPTKSPVAAAGIQSGDVITAVNGYQLSGPKQVATAMAAFSDTRRFRLDITRRQRSLSLYYEIRND